MPRFFSNVTGERNVRDQFGLIRRDDAHAITWAKNILDLDALQYQYPSAVVIAIREDGREAARIPIPDPSNRLLPRNSRPDSTGWSSGCGTLSERGKLSGSHATNRRSAPSNLNDFTHISEISRDVKRRWEITYEKNEGIR